MYGDLILKGNDIAVNLLIDKACGEIKTEVKEWVSLAKLGTLNVSKFLEMVKHGEEVYCTTA
ncbi:MAG: hypothetical protein ACW990_14840, partial [Promethearchaeota archaeon]